MERLVGSVSESQAKRWCFSALRLPMTIPCPRAVQHISRLPGGSQPQPMRCSDQAFYVVKFKNNPQSKQILANDYVGTQLAQAIGLPVPAVSVIHVRRELIRATHGLRIELKKGSKKFCPGRQFGSRLVTPPQSGAVVDWIPTTFFGTWTLMLIVLEFYDRESGWLGGARVCSGHSAAQKSQSSSGRHSGLARFPSVMPWRLRAQSLRNPHSLHLSDSSAAALSAVLSSGKVLGDCR